MQCKSGKWNLIVQNCMQPTTIKYSKTVKNKEICLHIIVAPVPADDKAANQAAYLCLMVKEFLDHQGIL